MENYEFCILKDEKDIIEYEKGLYDAFIKKDPDGWVSKNYDIINNCRLRSKISYSYQTIYAVKINDEIIACGAVNFNPDMLQLEKMGFIIQKNISDKICEGINLFISRDMGDQTIGILGGLNSYIFDDLKKRGITIAYGTCSRKLKALYTIYGFEVIDRKIIEEDKKLLLRYLIK
jgi:hypothetical protein